MPPKRSPKSVEKTKSSSYLNEEKPVIILLEDLRLVKQPLDNGSVSISKMMFFYLNRPFFLIR